MNRTKPDIVKSPKWVAILSSISSGWLSGIIIFVISMITILNLYVSYQGRIGKSSIISTQAMFISLATATLIGIVLGIIVGKSLYLWFCNRKKSTGIILFIILLLLALAFPISLAPRPMKYVHVESNKTS